MTRVAMLYTRLRAEERALVEAADETGVEVEPVWDEQVALDAGSAPDWVDQADLALVRTLSLNRALALTRGLERHGLPCVNGHDTLSTCGDKWATSLALAEAGVPTPETRLATTVDEALDAADELGYPVVTKPLTGSWARGLARCNDRHALEGVLEQREAYAGPVHRQHYLQAYVDKPGRDVRAFVADDEVLCAIHREADHWITNTARGAEASNRPVTPELEAVCRRAAEAVGGGVLAVDLMETGDGLVVHEVNATMEFRNSIEPTGVDIPRRVIEHLAGPRPEVPA